MCRELREAESNVIDIPVEQPEVMAEGEDYGEEDIPVPPLTEKYTIPTYPAPYVRLANGGVGVKIRDKEGNVEEREIYKRDLYICKRMFDPVRVTSLNTIQNARVYKL